MSTNLKMDTLRKKGLCRKIGTLEQFLCARAWNGYYNNFAVTAEFDAPVNAGQIFSVLRKMILKHSMLSVNYSYATNEIFTIDKIYYKDVVEFETRTSPVNYDELLDHVETYKFRLNTQDPLFKVLVTNDTYVTIIFEHAFTDGGSGYNFQAIFLKELNNLTEEESKITIQDDSLLFDLTKDIDLIATLPPKTEDVIPGTPDLLFHTKKWVKSWLPDYLKSYINDHNYVEIPSGDVNGATMITRYPNPTPPLDLKYNSFFKVFNISSEQCGKLIALARDHKVTVTPIIEIIYLQTLVNYDIFQNTSPDESYYIGSMLPINLRRYSPPEQQEMLAIGARVFPGIVNNIPIANLMKSCNDEQYFWELCKRSAKNITLSSTDSRAVMNYGVRLDAFANPDTLDTMAGKLKDDFTGAVSGTTTRFSNVGLFKNTPGAYKITDLVFTQSIGLNGGKIVLNTISTEAKGMNFCFSTLDGVFKDKEDIASFCDLFKSNILKIINDR